MGGVRGDANPNPSLSPNPNPNPNPNPSPNPNPNQVACEETRRKARDLTELSVTLSPISSAGDARRDWWRGGGAACEAAADTSNPNP